MIMLSSLLIAILFGLVSTSANLLFISIVVAFFIGGFLLTRATWIVWAVLVSGLVVVGIAPLVEAALDPKVGWPVSILCFILMAIAFFKAATNRDTRNDTPGFIWLMFSFFVYAVVNSLLQWHSLEEFIGGFKRYFQIFGLLFALCWLDFDERHIHRWKVFFLLVALVQLPFAIYELVALVPLREGMRNFISGMVPIDAVAGTFGSTLYGGGSSGEMSTFLVMVLAFLLSRRTQKTLPAGRFILLAFWVSTPLFLGETKAAIIMLPLIFLALYRRELLARPHYALMALLICALFTAGMGYAYINIMKMSPDKLFTNTLSYNLYEQGYGLNYLNRTTVLTFWVERQGAHDPVSFVFGNGLGSSHQQTEGHVDIRYPRYGIGMTSVSTLFWDVGAFGVGLFAAVFIQAWRTSGRLYRESTEPEVRADVAAIQAALLLFAFHLFYNQALLENIAIQIVFASVLGYLAGLHRRHVQPIAGRRFSTA